jgi:hypothetical protein
VARKERLQWLKFSTIFGERQKQSFFCTDGRVVQERARKGERDHLCFTPDGILISIENDGEVIMAPAVALLVAR